MAEAEVDENPDVSTVEKKRTEPKQDVEPPPPVVRDNPQEASSPPHADFSVTVHDENDTVEPIEEPVKPPSTASSSRSLRKSRKRRRTARERKISNRATKSNLQLPPNQYECFLIRTAIRKAPESSDAPVTNAEEQSDELQENVADGLDIYGDTSLGMKLSVIQGHVIIQRLNCLSDGRASPAQMSLVQRGDVILSVNDVSLVSLPIDQLMQGLAPLSTPNANGDFDRVVSLRLASQEGISMLVQSESVVKPATLPTSDNFLSLLMVDQLSGQPLVSESLSEHENTPVSVPLDPPSMPPVTPRIQSAMEVPLVERIAKDVADWTQRDRKAFTSGFFEMNESLPGTLRTPEEPELPDMESDAESEDQQIQADQVQERSLIGRRALRGAIALSLNAERVDRGDDVRSFRSWNTNLSLYSRASTRRRYVLDANTALPVHFDTVVEEEEEDGNDDKSDGEGTNASDETPLETDELLLRLAAHDDIWRRQVVEFLSRSDDEEVEGDGVGNGGKNDLEDAFSSDFGALLFGENTARVFKSNRRTKALPKEAITAVLFDLTTKITSTIPDEITAVGTTVSFRTRLVPFTGMKKAAPDSEAKLAFNYLVDEALPVWLESFKPLPWEYRRILWPLDPALERGDENAGASTWSDELTADSLNSSMQQSPKVKKKNLRELIEDHEMDAESKGETCFLATFYFTQKLLPDLMRKQEARGAENVDVKELTDFIVRYGSYLKMHTCLAYATVLKAQTVILELLQMAKHDPVHRQGLSQIMNGEALTVYEPTMLSAVIQQLYNIHQESLSKEKRLAVIDCCTSAYPDVRPWQVRLVCVENATENVDFSPLYYTFLSALLHPLDGHDSARNDKSLVNEWCELSANAREDAAKWQNFLYVASRSSSHHLGYHRDLKFLLGLASTTGDDNLVFDLSNEILDDTLLAKDSKTIQLILSYLRKAAFQSLESLGESNTPSLTMKRVLRLYRKMSSSFSDVARMAIDVPAELQQFVDRRKNQSRSPDSVHEMLEFVANEAEPPDVLQTLSRLGDLDLSDRVFGLLRTCARRGAHNSVNRELSGSLLKLRKGRSFDSDEGFSAHRSIPGTIWQSMSDGNASLEK